MKNIIRLNWGANVLLSVSLLFMIAGCAKKEVSKDHITITFACIYSPLDEGVKIIEKSLNEFEELNPKIKVRRLWLSGSYQQYFQKILTMIAGGTPPDIFRTSTDMLPPLMQKGLLLPLDEYIKNSNALSSDDFFPQVLHKYRFDGKEIGKGPVYGLATDWSPGYALFYNKGLFDEAGISYPTKSLSWEEFLEIAKKLTIRDEGGRAKQFGTLVPPLTLLIYQNGGKVFSEDGKKCLLDSPEVVESIQFLHDLRNKFRVAPSLSEGRDMSNIVALFHTGGLGMFFSGRYRVPSLEKLVNKKFSYSVAPSLQRKNRVNLLTGPCGFVISSRTKHPEETFRLLEYLVAGEGEIRLAEIGYNIPVIKKIAYSDSFLTNPDHPEGINKLFLEEVIYTVPSPINIYISADRWHGIINEELDWVYLERKTPEEAAKTMSIRINKLISSQMQKKGVK